MPVLGGSSVAARRVGFQAAETRVYVGSFPRGAPKRQRRRPALVGVFFCGASPSPRSTFARVPR